MIGVTLKDVVDPGVSVTLKWSGPATKLKMEAEGGGSLPSDLDLDPGDLLDALTVLAAQRVDRADQHPSHAYSEYPGPGSSLGVFRDQLTGKSEVDDG